MALDLSYDAVFSLFLVTVCANTVLIFGFETLFQEQQWLVVSLLSPWQFAAITLVTNLAISLGIAWIGPKFSGQGSFQAVMGLVAWFQVVKLGMQVVLTFTLILPFGFAIFVLLGTIGWSLWIFIAFFDEVHQFDNMLKSSLVALLGSAIGMFGLILIILLFVDLGGVGSGI
ncbi:hypothetical protein GN278_11150 [Rhodobacteraceae bacterium Araon29]